MEMQLQIFTVAFFVIYSVGVLVDGKALTGTDLAFPLQPFDSMDVTLSVYVSVTSGNLWISDGLSLWHSLLNHRKNIPLPDKWQYVGCYQDKRPRDLTSYHKTTGHHSDMDLERCYRFCSGYKTMYMALQNGDECRCDNSYGRYGRLRERECDEECNGDSKQICGGDFANSVYRIREQPATQVTSNMMPLRASTAKLTFSALGDWGITGSAQSRVARALGVWSAAHQSAFTVALGDNFYENGVSSVKDSQFQTKWKRVFTHKSLQHPWLVVEGNHDYYDGHAPYQVMYGDTDKRWVMPSLYYSMYYTVGNKKLHLVFIDTDPIRNDQEYHQYNWFRNELATSTADWIIVLGHHPVGSSGNHGKSSSTSTMYEHIRSEMVKNKVALYICGHDHIMEHLVDSSGTLDYVIAGSGGKLRTSGKSSSAVDNLRKKNITSKFWREVNGFAGITVNGDQVTVTFVDSRGREVYRFTKSNPRKSTNKNVIG